MIRSARVLLLVIMGWGVSACDRGPAGKVDGFLLAGIPFVELPAGQFEMGSPPGEPSRDAATEDQQTVVFDAPFAISVREITRAEYWGVVEPKRQLDEKQRDQPVTDVSWDEAVAFCELLSQRLPGKRFRLPTEAEWEYACRAGSPHAFGVWVGSTPQETMLKRTSDTNDDSALCRRAKRLFNFDSHAAMPVGRFAPNAWGLHDMHGNVWEWCATATGDDEAASLARRPVRGGAWTSPTCLDCRSARRASERRDTRKASIGFRVLLENP